MAMGAVDNQGADEALLAQIARGDRGAMKTLYDRHAGPLRRFAAIWLADPLEAPDIVHETMLDVWRGAGTFAGRSSARSWMFSIARNKAVDRNRKRGRTVLDDPDPEIADHAPDPDAVLQSFQDAARVRACIDTLSAPHRSAIHLAFFEDLSYREIADLEKVPVGTIKTRILHAKKLLMRCLTQ